MRQKFSRWVNLRMAAVFGGAAALVLLAGWLASTAVQLAVLGVLLAVVLAVVVGRTSDPLSRGTDADLLTLPLTLARDDDLFGLYRQIGGALREIGQRGDPLYRKLAVQRTGELTHELTQVAGGRVVFSGTETWRMVYAQLLRSAGLHLYRSVALVKTANYWQDEPGRQSTRLNLELASSTRINIERIVIIADPLWPADHRFPLDPLHAWIDAQHRNGIAVKLVRLSAVVGEPDLAADFGIYGSRAVGDQELDDHGRTVRFTLSFNFDDVLAAEQRWERLSVYATRYRDLLEEAARR